MKPKSGPKKPPVVRRGQHKPYVKPSATDIEKRVDLVEVLLGRRARKGQIHAIIGKKFNVEWRTVDNYIARARVRLLQRLSETKNEHRAKSLALYEQVIMTGTGREKVIAQERIDKLLGLEAPRQIGLGGGEGMPPIKSETDDKGSRPFKGVKKSDLIAVIALARNQKNGSLKKNHRNGS